MAERRASRKTKSPRVFGHPSKQAQSKLRVGLYAHVSTQDQQTIPLQTRAMPEYATPAGLDDRFASEGNRLGCYPAGATGAMAGLLAVFAEFEREILRERVRASLAQARQNGPTPGPAGNGSTPCRPGTEALPCGSQQSRDCPPLGNWTHFGAPHPGRKDSTMSGPP